jgi:hypothetical protein
MERIGTNKTKSTKRWDMTDLLKSRRVKAAMIARSGAAYSSLFCPSP